MGNRRSISRSELVRQLRDLGVAEGDVLLVHTAFSAIGPGDGGPTGLIRALMDAVGSAGTLVMPSWSGSDDEPFDPATSEPSADLGVVPGTFWRSPGVRRSGHVHAFAAIGPEAERILGDPLPLPPHIPESPVGRVHELDGKVLLLGVNHDADTTIHLAEVVSDVPYRVRRHCTVLRNGRPERIEYHENDHCCARFALVDDWLRHAGLQAEGTVGHARARLARSRSVVEVVSAHLEEDPLLFLHPPEAVCDECDEACRSVRHQR